MFQGCTFATWCALKIVFFLVCVVISNLQKEKALCCFLDQFICDILWVKLCPELNQQRVVLLHILSCHLGLVSNSRGMPQVRNKY